MNRLWERYFIQLFIRETDNAHARYSNKIKWKIVL